MRRNDRIELANEEVGEVGEIRENDNDENDNNTSDNEDSIHEDINASPSVHSHTDDSLDPFIS
jgi:hypothetical protein